MKAVILAGGLGTRISEETSTRPKPMIEIGGKPILWHILKTYSHHGINDFVICCGYKGYVIKEYFANYFLHMSDVTFNMSKNSMEVHQQSAEPWRVTLVNTGEDTMTGGRVRRIADYVREDDAFCLTYGDGVSDVNITKLIEFHETQNIKATLTAIIPPGRFGALRINGNKVQSFQEKPEGDGAVINGGFFVLSPEIFDYITDDQTILEQDPLRPIPAPWGGDFYYELPMKNKIKEIIKRKIPFILAALRSAKSYLGQIFSKSKIKQLMKGRDRIYLEVGAGNKKGENGWVTIDMTEHCDIYWDLRKGIPFPDSSISKIYSSHFLEHLTFKEGQIFLAECLRVLTPGGNFSICIPNARWYIEAYMNNRVLDADPYFGHKPALNNTTKIDYVNYMAYMDGHHKYMFDEENIIFLLNSMGFQNARARKFDSSLDLKERDFESIYVEAEK